MAGPWDVLFQEHVGNAKRGAGLAPGLVQGFIELLIAEHHAHAPAAAAHGRLDDDRIAEPAGHFAGLGIAGQSRRAAGQYRHAGLLSDPAGRDLIAELFEDLDPWP